MKLCKHDNYQIIDWIREPKYSTDQVLIATGKITSAPHYLLKFQECNKYPHWYYLSRKDITTSKIQSNGKLEVYAVPMSRAQDFEPINNCEHNY